MFKHVGKMKHNDAKVCVIYRTLPGDAKSALVVGTATLTDSYHNSLMSVVESIQGQQVNELGDILSTRYFPDGTNILEQLHLTGKLVRVSTDKVLMTPTPTDQISLDELNLMIAEQKGVTLDDLAIKDDMPHKKNKTQVQEVEIKDLTKSPDALSVKETLTPQDIAPPVSSQAFNNTSIELKENMSASDYRSRADWLYKEAAKLRKLADELDPPKKKVTSGQKAEKTN